MTFTMSEPMNFTLPTHGCIYVHTLLVLSILEPGIQSQLLYPVNPVIPPQTSNSVPPYLYSANCHLQPLLSPSIISPTLSLPHILSTTPDNILHHQSLMPSAYCWLNNPYLHQPTPHSSPRLSYVTHQSVHPPPIIAHASHHHSIPPVPINVPVPCVPIPNFNHSHNIHSWAASLRPSPIATLIKNFYTPQYAPAATPDAMNLPLQTHSQAHSHQTLCPSSSVMKSHHSYPNSLFVRPLLI